MSKATAVSVAPDSGWVMDGSSRWGWWSSSLWSGRASGRGPAPPAFVPAVCSTRTPPRSWESRRRAGRVRRDGRTSLESSRWCSSPTRTLPDGGREAMPDARPIHYVAVEASGWTRRRSPTPSSPASSRRPATSPWPSDRRSAEGLSRARTPRGPVARLARLHAARRPVPLDNLVDWWRCVPAPDWRHPEGPGSDRGADDHPVVHVAWDDAARLREVGRQAAADRGRVGVRRPRRPDGKKYAWGDELQARRPGGWPTPGRATSRTRTPARTASPGPRPCGRSRPTATACTTWRATSGSGAPTGIGPTPTPGCRVRRRRPTTPRAAQQLRPGRALAGQARQRGGSFLCSDQYCTPVHGRHPGQGRGLQCQQLPQGFRCVRPDQ